MMSLLQMKTYLYTKLSSDPSLITLMGGVNIYDTVQESAKLPYIAFEKAHSKNVHLLDAETVEHAINFVIVAPADSCLTTHNIMARIEQIFDELVDEDDLTEGFRLMKVALNSTQIEQIDFDLVKGRMAITFYIEKGVGI